MPGFYNSHQNEGKMEKGNCCCQFFFLVVQIVKHGCPDTFTQLHIAQYTAGCKRSSGNILNKPQSLSHWKVLKPFMYFWIFWFCREFIVADLRVKYFTCRMWIVKIILCQTKSSYWMSSEWVLITMVQAWTNLKLSQWSLVANWSNFPVIHFSLFMHVKGMSECRLFNELGLVQFLLFLDHIVHFHGAVSGRRIERQWPACVWVLMASCCSLLVRWSRCGTWTPKRSTGWVHCCLLLFKTSPLHIYTLNLTLAWMLILLEMISVSFLSVLQRFTGHSTAVTTLCFATTRPPDSNGLYFLSGAAHDRLLSVWWGHRTFQRGVCWRASRHDGNIMFLSQASAGGRKRQEFSGFLHADGRAATHRPCHVQQQRRGQKFYQLNHHFNWITSHCFVLFFCPIVRSAEITDCVMLVLCTGSAAGGGVQGRAAASLRALFKRVRCD